MPGGLASGQRGTPKLREPLAKRKKYQGMAYDEDLARRIQSLLQNRTDIEEKKMFGGLDAANARFSAKASIPLF